MGHIPESATERVAARVRPEQPAVPCQGRATGPARRSAWSLTRARSSASPDWPVRARPRCCCGCSTGRGATPGQRHGRGGGRRPTERWPLPAVVDHQEHLDRVAARDDARLAPGRPGGDPPGSHLEGPSHDPDARHGETHPVALGRQPAEGAVRARARFQGRHHPHGRPHARRRRGDQARGLRPHP